MLVNMLHELLAQSAVDIAGFALAKTKGAEWPVTSLGCGEVVIRRLHRSIWCNLPKSVDKPGGNDSRHIATLMAGNFFPQTSAALSNKKPADARFRYEALLTLHRKMLEDWTKRNDWKITQ